MRIYTTNILCTDGCFIISNNKHLQYTTSQYSHSNHSRRLPIKCYADNIILILLQLAYYPQLCRTFWGFISAVFSSYFPWLIHIYTADPALNGCFMPIRSSPFYIKAFNIFLWVRTDWVASVLLESIFVILILQVRYIEIMWTKTMYILFVEVE